MKLRPADFLLAVVVFVTCAWWAYLAGTSEQPEPSRDTAPAPWTPQTVAPAVEVDG